MLDVEHTTVGGLPAYVADAPGRVTAGLVFRVGQADEVLRRGARRGASDRAAAGGADPDRGGATVDLLHTTFHVSGEADEVAAELEAIGRRLADLPVERLDDERRVLAIESLGRPPGALDELLAATFGARGPGLVGFEEVGLRDASADQAREHARRWFTAGNAVLFSSAPLRELDLGLPDGPRRPAGDAERLPGRAGGVEVEGQQSPAVLGGTVTEATGPLRALLERRAAAAVRDRAALAYDVRCERMDIGARARFLVLQTDALAADATPVARLVLDVLDELAGGGVTDEGVENLRGRLRAGIEEVPAFGVAAGLAAHHAVTGEPTDLAAELARIASLTPGTLVAAARELRRDVVVAMPPGTTTGRLPRPDQAPEPVEGVKHRRRLASRHADAADLVVGPDGVSALDAEQGVRTVRWATCAAALRTLGGGLVLLDEDGSAVAAHPEDVRDGPKALARIEAALAPTLIAPLDDASRRVGETPTGRFARLSAADAPEIVASLLGADERVTHMVDASSGVRAGVVAVTGRRVLFAARVLRDHVEELPLDAIREVRVRTAPWWPAVTLTSAKGDWRLTVTTPRRARALGAAIDAARRAG